MNLKKKNNTNEIIKEMEIIWRKEKNVNLMRLMNLINRLNCVIYVYTYRGIRRDRRHFSRRSGYKESGGRAVYYFLAFIINDTIFSSISLSYGGPVKEWDYYNIITKSFKQTYDLNFLSALERSPSNGRFFSLPATGELLAPLCGVLLAPDCNPFLMGTVVGGGILMLGR